jgi:hypothetical protein
VGLYEYEDERDREEAEALERAQTVILEIARREQPESLAELRDLIERDAPPDIDPALLRLGLWSLLSDNRLELTADRALRVAS